MRKRNIFILDVKITPTRFEVISGLLKHRARKGLGDFIGMPQNTVNGHLKILYALFHVHTVGEFILLMVANGFNHKGQWTGTA